MNDRECKGMAAGLHIIGVMRACPYDSLEEEEGR